jgi:hypothetical protein
MGYCTTCGSLRRQGAKFCPACGGALSDAASAGTPLTPAVDPIPTSGSDRPGHSPAASGQPGDLPARQAGPSADPSSSAGWGYQDSPPPPPHGSQETTRWNREAVHSPPGWDLAGSQPPPAPAPRRRGARFAVASLAAVAIAVAGGGGAFWWVRTHHEQSRAEAAQTGNPAQNGSSPLSGTASGAPAPSAAPSMSPGSSATSGVLTVAPAVSQNADASPVESFLNSYFSAINNHDYQQFRSLLDQKMAQGESAQNFDDGYGSTRDSDATLTAISNMGAGQVSAAVTFTSHQSPSQSPSSSACTNWNVTLYLASTETGYMLEAAPAGYHAAYQAC